MDGELTDTPDAEQENSRPVPMETDEKAEESSSMVLQQQSQGQQKLIQKSTPSPQPSPPQKESPTVPQPPTTLTSQENVKMDIDTEQQGSPDQPQGQPLKRKESPVLNSGRSSPEPECKKTKMEKGVRNDQDKKRIILERVRKYRRFVQQGCGRARCKSKNHCADGTIRTPSGKGDGERALSMLALQLFKSSAPFCEFYSPPPLTLDFVQQAFKGFERRVEAGEVPHADSEDEDDVGPEHDDQLINELVSPFAHMSLPHLDRCFIADPASGVSRDDPNIDMDAMQEVFDEILQIDGGENTFVQVYGKEFKKRHCLLHDRLQVLSTRDKKDGLTQDDLQLLRRMFILLNCPVFITMDPGIYESNMWTAVSLLNFCLKQHEEVVKILIQWGVKCWGKDGVENILHTLQQYITIEWEKIFESDRIERVVLDSSMNEILGPAVRLLDIIHMVEQERVKNLPPEKKGDAIPETDWYNESISAEFAKGTGVAKYDYLRWIRKQNNEVAISNYPWILDAGSKAQILLTDSRYQMREEMDRQMRSTVFAQMIAGAANGGGGLDMNRLKMSPYLLLKVSRTNIMQDALKQLLNCDSRHYKKPLRIQFVGEEGIDEGGVKKEFFQLAVGRIFDRNFGLFVFNEETREYWFNRDSLESHLEFELIGILCGLAIYNHVILDVRWPSLVFKKLLDVPMTREEFHEFDPAMAKSFDKLLEFEGNVEETMCLAFSYEYQWMGQEKVEDLKPNGRNIPVTNENRKEYVDLYIDYILNKSIKKQFDSFKQGFFLVCEGRALKLFQWKELELMVCGSPVFNFEALEGSCRYDDGYSKESAVIKNLWEVLHSLDDARKRKFLEFTTGSDRVPIRGLGDLSLVITKAGGDSSLQLPTSHTCFNHLLLPEYATKEILRERLLVAITYSKGFGLK